MSLDIAINPRAYSDIVISDDPFAAFYPDPTVQPARGHVYAIVTGLDASVQHIYLGAFKKGQQVVFPITPMADQNVSFAVIAEAADGTREFSSIRDAIKVTALQTVNVYDYAQNIGDGSTNPITVTHNLNSEDLHVEFRETSGNKLAASLSWESDPSDPLNKIKVTVAVPLGLNAMRVIIKK